MGSMDGGVSSGGGRGEVKGPAGAGGRGGAVGRMGQDQYDYLFKFIVIGDAGAGKSCLLHQFIEGKFKKSSSHTIGVEFGSKIITVNNRTIKLQIWDTAGQERYRSVTRSYYRGAAGALIVYDITNRETYQHLLNWLADARTLARADISIIAVGNKSDLNQKRNVTFLESSRLAQENDLLFLETSALTGEGVEEVFTKVAKQILAKIEDGLIDPNTMVSGIHSSQKRAGGAGGGAGAGGSALSGGGDDDGLQLGGKGGGGGSGAVASKCAC